MLASFEAPDGGASRAAVWGFPKLLRRGRTWLLVVPATLLLLVFFVWPLTRLLELSFVDESGSFSLANYARVFLQGPYLRVLWNTVEIAAYVTVISTVLAYPVAYLLSTLRESPRSLWMIVVLLPFWTGFLVRTFAWIVLLQNTGVINRALLATGIISEPVPLMYNLPGVLIGTVHILLPYGILTMLSVMEGIDHRLVQAARTMGASPFQAFFRVYLPLSAPGVAAGSLLIFIMTLGFFVTPALLGGRSQLVISQLIETQVNSLLNWGFGSALAFVLFALTLLCYFVYARIVGLESVAGTGATRGALRPSTTVAPRALGARFAGRLADALLKRADRVVTWATRGTGQFAGARILLWVAALAVLGYLVLPLLVVIPVSLTGASFLEFPPTSLSWRWYEEYFADPQWVDATLLSLRVGVESAALATAIGAAASFGIVRGSFPFKSALSGFLLGPMVIPRMVVAIGIFGFYAQLELVGTELGLVIAHTVLAIPIVTITLSTVLRSYDVRLDHAAQTLGASPARTFRTVTFPILRTGFISAALFAFITSFDELIVAIFITGGALQTLPRKMWDDIYLQVNPTLAAVSTLLILSVVVLLLFVELMRRRLQRVATRT